MNSTTAQAPGTIHDFTMKSIDGKDISLKDYKGKALLVVNVASQCGYTKQYADLEKLYETYKGKGLEVLGFPANNFGGQEPGTDEEIKEFCSTKFDVKFPMFSKISVLGDDKNELYQYLTADGQDVEWNFEKFLIGKDGKVLKHYKSGVKPMDEELLKDIESALK
ncbi:MAG: glutathione peroxidase [Bacteroidota bacterium]